ncbi:MAG TPA: DUF6600 domain-containing protein [Burkholderiaceae bacterium]|jgi:hypothetical protein
MTSIISHRKVNGLLLGIIATAISGMALADPPTRVARLSYTAGETSYSPAGENDWVDAPLNRPLTTGDRIWAGAGGQDELQLGSAVIRMGDNTSVTLLNLDDRTAQVQLAQGSLNVHVRRMQQDEVFEIDTPNLAFNLREPGDYRVDVDADGYATTVAVHRGRGDVVGEGTAYTVGAAQSYRFAGTGLHEYQALAMSPPDEFDRWSSQREARAEHSSSARYVSPDMIGYEDLDDHGSWRSDTVYGNVWVPSHVAADWAPYHDGHWSWVEPWGWTWVDSAPWGFAVSHYGRWVNQHNQWGWVPGPVVARPVYAPALVAFVGGNGFSVSVSGGHVAGVAWFPLAPQDVYRPSYKVSLNYFANVNTGSTTVNHTNITNVYNNTNVTNITYVNRAVPGAVVAVTATAFTQSQPVARSAIKLNNAEIGSAKMATVAMVAPVAPVAASVRGAAPAGHAPPPAALTRQVVVNTAPPPAPIPFAVRQPAMAANPGKPLDSAALAKIAPAAPAPAAPVKLVHPPQAVAPITNAPPSVAVPQSPNRGGKPGEARGPAPMPEAPAKAAETPAKPATPVTPAMPLAPATPTAPTPRGKPGEAEPASAPLAHPMPPRDTAPAAQGKLPAEPPHAAPHEQTHEPKPAPTPPSQPIAEPKPAPMPIPPHDQTRNPPPAPMPSHEQFHGPVSIPAEPPREARPAPAPGPMPEHDRAHEPLNVPRGTPAPQPEPKPAPQAPTPHQPSNSPPVVHAPPAPATPQPKPEPGKHEDPRGEKGSGKNPQDNNEH